MNYGEILLLAAPETILVLIALAVVGADLIALNGVELRFRRVIGGMVAGIGCLGAIVWTQISHAHGNIGAGMLVVDPLTQSVKVALLVLTLFTIVLSMDSDFTTHVGEYLALLLMATVGMMFLVSAEDILMIFISLELTSLSLYILAAFNKRDIKSAEAGLKYFLFGGMSAAFTLFGLSLVYGLSGATNLREIAGALQGQSADPLLLVAIVMVVIGFGFKVAAVPFHLWAPDAYQGAPTPSAALIASGSKVASFFIFAKVMALGFEGAEGSSAFRGFEAGWVPVIAMVAVLSMILGNLAAIVQSSVRRLLAYSAVAHAGYVLLAVMAPGEQTLESLIYYIVTYGLTAVGAFGVVAIVEQGTGSDRMTNFAGLSRRSPLMAGCMLIFLLSLAGIPPLAGFFGKFYLFAAVLSSPAPGMDALGLVILAIAMSAVSLYYYLQVLKQIYVAEEPEPDSPFGVPVISQVAILLLALSVVLLGCAPNLLLSWLHRAAAMSIPG